MASKDALFGAAREGHLDDVKSCLARKIDVNCKDSGGRTPLLWACYYGQLAVAQYLVQQGGDVFRATTDGHTPLSSAAERGHLGIVQFLVQHGVDVNSMVHDKTPLLHAAERGHLGLVKFLVSQGADVDKESLIDGCTPTFVAACYGFALVVTFLKQNGADINRPNRIGWSPVYVATEQGHLEVVQCLVQLGADVNLANREGDTPLHAAMRADRFEVCAYLLAQNADSAQRNKGGKLCFDVVPRDRRLLCLSRLLTLWDGTRDVLQRHDYHLWFVIVQEDEPFPSKSTMKAIGYYSSVLEKVLAMVQTHNTLGTVKDINGRVAIDVAAPPMRRAMQSVLNWHGRYRPTELRPEAVSSTCYVFKAVDEHIVDKETSLPLKVALKLVRKKTPFLREMKARDRGFSDEFVVNVLASTLGSNTELGQKSLQSAVQLMLGAEGPTSTTPGSQQASESTAPSTRPAAGAGGGGGGVENGDRNVKGTNNLDPDGLKTPDGSKTPTKNNKYASLDGLPEDMEDVEADATTGMLTKVQAQKLFLLVMPLADRNLYTSLKQERWAGRDFDEVRHVFRQLVNCVLHMHGKGMLHGDLKPSNIVRWARTLRWMLLHTHTLPLIMSYQHAISSHHII